MRGFPVRAKRGRWEGGASHHGLLVHDSILHESSRSPPPELKVGTHLTLCIRLKVQPLSEGNEWVPLQVDSGVAGEGRER